eukprot:TRINITY_DN8499_c0_g1_i1.p1 TRINITY_DN8499_c0_g1~~TRINITY_DN8499_c0_g1_i1.p1  ORF type:complete len:824 (-),score=212.32 TRINITY_DN8499_c0_g1_i1:125-2572(-)
MATEPRKEEIVEAIEEKIANLKSYLCIEYKKQLVKENEFIVHSSCGVFERPAKEAVNVSEMPRNHHTNSAAEELVLEYVENFRRQLVRLYPHRAGLFITPENECGVVKFAPSFIRPVKLKFKELNEYKGCATFVANFLNYVPLSDPKAVPKRLISPATLLSWQKGNSFDFSTLLVSLLIGAGYDAYCVSGYAHKDIAQLDLTKKPCPLIVSHEKKTEASPDAIPNSYANLVIKRVETFESTYLAMLAKRNTEQKTDTSAAVAETAAADPRQIHCWVLVRLPARDITESFFIEPATGEVMPLNHPGYFSVENVWNNKNFWVNMQRNSPITYDMQNMDKWDAVFMEEKEDPSSTKKVLKLAPAWVVQPTVTSSEYNDKYPNCHKTMFYQNCVADMYSEHYLANGLVCKLTITSDPQYTCVTQIQEIFANRNDKLSKRLRYFDNGVEVSSHEFFEHGRLNGLAQLVSSTEEAGKRTMMMFFPDGESPRIDGLLSREVVGKTKITETFANREDRLILRRARLQPLKVGEERVHLIDTDAGETASQIGKITAKFARDAEKPADADPEKIVFYLLEKRIDVTYHKAKGKITASSRTYTKDGQSTGFTVDPFAPKPTTKQMLEDLEVFIKLEARCLDALRANQKEADEITLQREREESNIQLKLSIYDTDFRKYGQKKVPAEQDLVNAEVADKPGIEYLKPYLVLLSTEKKTLTPELAVLIERACMASYRARVEAQEQLIISRLEHAKQMLKHHAETWSKKYETAGMTPDPVDVDAHKKFTEATLFTMHVLERRRKKHEAEAPQGYQKFSQLIANELGIPTQ